MSIDISRKSFDHRRNTTWTTTMQGRVMTDAPLNEDRRIRDRALRSLTVDLIGRTGYPQILPDSFRIEVIGGALFIHPGRYAVDGHWANNHGTGGPVFDAVLSELTGPDPVPFGDQPWRPGFEPDPPEDGRHLVYLDVWQRHVTHLEDDSILDPAVAVDTFARRQTVWQVRTHGPVGDITCATPDDEIPDWPAEIRPSDARLTTRANPASAVTDPCILPPGAEYLGTDNRAYLFVVDSIAADGTPMVKFSRTHGTVATRILARPLANTLEVVQAAKGDFLRFNALDWSEITDEARLLAGEPGTLLRILEVDDTSNTITFDTDIPAGALRLVGAGPEADQDFHPVLRRWDQSSQVLDADGNEIVDLDLAGSDGLIPAPTDGTFIALEDGVEAALTLADPAGAPRIGDAWTFITRYATGTVEELDAAPPDDFHHHYARLALVDAAGGAWVEPVVSDCRDPIADESCCTRIVSPGEDVQAAIDSLPPDFGGCVCLKPGLHLIQEAIHIERPLVTLHGEARGAAIRRETQGPVLTIGAGAYGVEVHTLYLEQGAPGNGSGVIEITEAREVGITGCVMTAGDGMLSIGVVLADADAISVRDCHVIGLAGGIGTVGPPCDGITVENCSFELGGEQFDGQFAVVTPGANGPVTVRRCRIRGALRGIGIIDDTFGLNRASLATGSIVAENEIELLHRPEDPDADVTLFGIDSGANETLVRGNRIRLAGSGRVGIRVSGVGAKVLANTVTGDMTVDDDARNFGLILGDGSDEPATSAQIIACANTLRQTTTGILANNVLDLLVEGNEMEPGRTAILPGLALQDVIGARIRANVMRGAGGGMTSVNGRFSEFSDNNIADCGFGIALALDVAPSLRGNRITNCALFGALAMFSLARVAYVENHVSIVGAAGGLPFGLGAMMILGEWHVESNEVLNVGLGPDGTANENPGAGIIGTLVMEARIESNLVSYTNVNDLPDGREDRALLMQGLMEIAFATGQQIVALGFPVQIADNKFIGKGASALVELRETQVGDNNVFIRFERVFFTSNYCMHFGGTPGRTAFTVVLAGRAGVAMGNQIKAANAHISMNFGGMAGTIVGNITEAGIVNHPNFPTPIGNFNLTI